MKFSIKDLITFTEEILNGNRIFLYSDPIKNLRLSILQKWLAT